MANAVKLIPHLPNIAQTTKISNVIADFIAKMTSDTSFCSTNTVATRVKEMGVPFNLLLDCADMSTIETFVGHSLHSNVVKSFNRVQIGRTVYFSKQNFVNGGISDMVKLTFVFSYKDGDKFSMKDILFL